MLAYLRVKQHICSAHSKVEQIADFIRGGWLPVYVASCSLPSILAITCLAGTGNVLGINFHI